jgi:hypothetical protein
LCQTQALRIVHKTAAFKFLWITSIRRNSCQQFFYIYFICEV